MPDTSRVKDKAAKQFLDSKLPDIERLFAPSHIILFGSRSTDHAREDSDIDLIVVSERFEGIRLPERMAQFLIALRPEADVEAFCYTPEEFELMRSRVNIVSEAAREGIWIQ